MTTLDEVYEAIFRMDEFERTGNEHPRLSYPLLEEVDDKTYVVFMGYSYGDIHPDLIYTYDIKTGETASMSTKDGLELFGIKEFPVEPRYHAEAGDKLLLQNYFWDAIETGRINRQKYNLYISTIANRILFSEAGYYWAFAD